MSSDSGIVSHGYFLSKASIFLNNFPRCDLWPPREQRSFLRVSMVVDNKTILSRVRTSCNRKQNKQQRSACLPSGVLLVESSYGTAQHLLEE